MIVRIATEGQYRLTDACLAKLNELDNRLVGTVMAKDEATFARVLSEMIDTVRREGTPLPIEELIPSDIILPAPNTTLEEAREIIKEDGIVSG